MDIVGNVDKNGSSVQVMVCLECGCDTWFEFKNNMELRTAEDCECHCHKNQVNKKLGDVDEM